VRQLNDVSKQNSYKGAVGANLDEKDLFQFRLWCSLAKNKRQYKIKCAFIHSDVVFTKISSHFL
jgi:hypothetical protein